MSQIETLIALGYLEERRNIDAPPNAAVRYAIADAAVRFYHRFVAPNASALARYPASELWTSRVAPRLDSYMGLEFERIAAQAYDALASTRSLPLVARWGKWEGTDRSGESLEFDLVAELIDGTFMTGSVKWDARPLDASVHHTHLATLRRAADAGRRWAHAALEPGAPLYYLAAAGFTPQFRKAVEASGRSAIMWSLNDIYP